MPAERSHVWTIYSKARSHFLHNGTQKVDRTSCTMDTMELKRSIALLAQWNSKGRSHFLHNGTQKVDRTFGQLTQKVDRTFRQFTQKLDNLVKRSIENRQTTTSINTLLLLSFPVFELEEYT
ncbi:hypothetical protein [Microcoleus sp. PH2017_28_MFU_U_A]|uniref:hypothetical protein n=1 Tax=Microcoleus sp. PH2017_28_MFU_U_A TaxID=2798838 RepID=UPI001DD00D8E|nr:hypothetical protein [Microcoleus sp. PH2017_28_MFU_U_A]MCC3594213.1 hypothetical protein [Microcoleus sp. PH2017_28_MFU_U_A]